MSTFWATGAQLSRLGGNAFVALAVSRLVPFDELGAYGMAFSILLLLQTLLRSGIPEALIQEQDTSPGFLSTVMYAQIGFGVLLTIGYLIVAYIIALSTKSALTFEYALAMSVCIIPTAIGSVFEGILRKELNYKSLAQRSAIIALMAAAAAMAALFLGASGWSLVIFTLVNSIAGAVLAARLCEWRPTLTFDRDAVRRVLSVSTSITLRALATASMTPVLQVLIGLELGTEAAGVFMVASRFFLLITALVMEPFREVTLPIFAAMRKDPERQRMALESVLRTLSLVMTPAFLGLAITAPAVSEIILGAAKAEPVSIALAALCLHGLVTCYSMVAIQFLTGSGMPNKALNITLLQALSNVVVTLILAGISLPVVMFGYTLRSWATTALPLYYLHKEGGISWRTLGSAIAKPLVASIIMCGACAWVAMQIADFPSFTVLSAQLVTGATLYILLVIVFMRKEVHSLLSIALRK